MFVLFLFFLSGEGDLDFYLRGSLLELYFCMNLSSFEGNAAVFSCRLSRSYFSLIRSLSSDN